MNIYFGSRALSSQLPFSIHKGFALNAKSTKSFRFATEKKKVYTTTTERKYFGELFWRQRQTFQTGSGYKRPIKTRKAISTTEIFPLWTPFFCKEKFCTRAGRCMVSFSQRNRSRCEFRRDLRSGETKH